MKTLSADCVNFLYNAVLSFLSKNNVKTLADEISRVLAEALRTREAALFLKTQNGYCIGGAFGLRKKKIQNIHLSLKSPFVRRLKKIQSAVIHKKQGDFSLEEFKVLFFKHALSNLTVDYIVPLKMKNKFFGFAVLGKLNRSAVDQPTNHAQNFDCNLPIENCKISDQKINVASPSRQGNEAAERLCFSLDLIKNLITPALLCLAQALLKEKSLAAQTKNKELRQIKDYLLAHFQSGVILISYSSEKILMINPKAKELLDGLKISLLNKNISEIIKHYPQTALAYLLKVYQEAKILRRSFRKNLFQNQERAFKAKKFLLNSVFIWSDKKNKLGDLILIEASEDRNFKK